jgi:hypothetical protein
MSVSVTTFALPLPVAEVDALEVAGVLGEVVSAVVVVVDAGELVAAVVIADVVPGVVVVDTVL